jgi:hypothetical protein
MGDFILGIHFFKTISYNPALIPQQKANVEDLPIPHLQCTNTFLPFDKYFNVDIAILSYSENIFSEGILSSLTGT